MIKKILVALDPDSDTPVAVRYAIDIARRYDAELTGLAVVDMESIGASSVGGGIGSMYYAEKLRERLTSETRLKAQELLAEFKEAVRDSGVRYGEAVEEGAPFQRILEDMKYHDLLVVGREPHFFYAHPEQKTETLVRIVKGTVAPVLVITGAYQPINRVLIAYDGSTPAARAMQRFAHLRPFDGTVSVKIVSVYEKHGEEAELTVRLARSYLEAHGFEVQAMTLSGNNPEDMIIEQAAHFNADLIVAGAHSVSKVEALAFGSTTAELLHSCSRPLFLDR